MTGQEAVWQRVGRRLGLSERHIQEYRRGRLSALRLDGLPGAAGWTASRGLVRAA